MKKAIRQESRSGTTIRKRFEIVLATRAEPVGQLEWADGYAKWFGVYADYATQSGLCDAEKNAKDERGVYGDVIARGGLA